VSKSENDNDGLAVVLPIRPGIQPGDTTPFGPARDDPDPEEELGETWGTVPHQRMTADPIDQPTEDNDQDDAGRATPRDASRNPRAREDTKPAADLRTRRRVPRVAWRLALPLTLALLAGAAIEIATATRPPAPHHNTEQTTARAQHTHPAASLLAGKPPTRTASHPNHQRRNQPTRASHRAPAKHPAIKRRATTTPTTTQATATHPASSSSVPAPATSDTATSQSTARYADQTEQQTSGTTASQASTPAPAQTQTRPGPTGPRALLGPGHCSC